MIIKFYVLQHREQFFQNKQLLEKVLPTCKYTVNNVKLMMASSPVVQGKFKHQSNTSSLLSDAVNPLVA